MTVRFKKVAVKKGKLTVNGAIGQPSSTSGGKLTLFAQKSGSTKFTQVGKASIGKGKTKFTVKAKLKTGTYVLQPPVLTQGADVQLLQAEVGLRTLGAVTQRRTRLSDPPKPDRPRSGIPPGRRLALGVAACLGLVVLPAAGAVADDSAPIVSATVYKAGGGTTTDTVTPDALHASSSQCPTYGPNEMDQYGRQGPVTLPRRPVTPGRWRRSWGVMQTPIALVP